MFRFKKTPSSVADPAVTPTVSQTASKRATAAPYTERVRHELRMRRLQVTSVSRITPNMVRVVLQGEALEGFTSHAADDHIKIFIPTETGSQPAKRDYTPRYYDTDKQALTLDFAVHEAGPATTWALQAKAGDWLEIGGPRGSQVIRGPIRQWLLIGDETALPAIGRRTEELASDTPVTAIVSIPQSTDKQSFDTQASFSGHWLSREQGERTDIVMECLRALTIEPGTFIWVAGETSMVRTVRQYLLEECGISKEWIKASGYWKQGVAESSERFDD